MKQIPVSPLTWLPSDAIELGEKNTLPSETQPDQALSLKELISRHSRGIPIPKFEPVYDGENNLPDVSRMTAIELRQLQEDMEELIEYHKAALVETPPAAEAAEPPSEPENDSE